MNTIDDSMMEDAEIILSREYLSTVYRVLKQESPNREMKLTFISAIRELIKQRSNVFIEDRLTSCYSEDKWGSGFCYTARNKGHLMVDDLRVVSVTDGVKFYKDGQLDFAISEDQLNRLAEIKFDITHAVGTLKGILELLFTRYIELIGVLRKEFYAA